jgi:hypothetical protein
LYSLTGIGSDFHTALQKRELYEKAAIDINSIYRWNFYACTDRKDKDLSSQHAAGSS